MSPAEHSADRVGQLEADLHALRSRFGYLLVAVGGLILLEIASVVAMVRREPVSLAALPAPSAKAQETVAQRLDALQFVLRDSAGNAKAVLGIGETGGPQLVMAGLHGKTTLTLGITSKHRDEPSLEMRDEKGELRILAALSGGGPGVSLWNSEGRQTINLHQSEMSGSQSSYLYFAGLKGKAFAQFGMTGDGDPDFMIVDGQGKRLVQVPPSP